MLPSLASKQSSQCLSPSQINTFSFDIFLKAGIPRDKIRYVTLGLGVSEIITSISCVSDIFSLYLSFCRKRSGCSVRLPLLPVFCMSCIILHTQHMVVCLSCQCSPACCHITYLKAMLPFIQHSTSKAPPPSTCSLQAFTFEQSCACHSPLPAVLSSVFRV